MSGITVLDEVTKLPIGYLGVIVVFALLAIGMVVLGYCCVKYNEHTWSKILAGVICGIILIGCIVGIIIIAPQTETYYKVLLDDNVTFTEFNTQYQVIEQEGSILTIIKR